MYEAAKPEDISQQDVIDSFFADTDLPIVARAIGIPAALRLLKVYQNQPIALPDWDAYEQACRDVQMWRAMRSGGVASQIGRQYGVVRQRVFQVFEATESKIRAYKNLVREGRHPRRVFSESIEADIQHLERLLKSPPDPDSEGGKGVGELL